MRLPVVTMGSQMLFVGVIALSSILPFVEGRGWKELAQIHDLAPVEPEEVTLQVNALVSEGDVMYYTMPPTPNPTVSLSPSDVPSLSAVPSTGPTAGPSVTPSLAPSSEPSSAPSDTASSFPTSTPTVDPYPENPAPSNPPRSYFNYDTSKNSKYGVNAWDNVEYERGEDYWAEFDYGGFGPWRGVLGEDLSRGNRCDDTRKQSPIDVFDTGLECEKHHQIRTKAGDFEINDDVNIEKQILPNKLRMKFARRPCPSCSEPDPPMADFPKYSSGFSDLLHIDIKIPSEHTIEGKRYPAEYQLYHLHHTRASSGSLGIMIDFNETSPYNEALGSAIDRFWVTFNRNAAECGRKLQKDRNLVSRVRGMLGLEMKDDTIDYETWDKFSTLNDVPPDDWTVTKKKRLGGEGTTDSNRKLQAHMDGPQVSNPNAWDPYDTEWLVKSFWFWGYGGSITEPPCSTMNDWFVLDTPMMISKFQMDQLKHLLFLNVDGNCKHTSVQRDHSVARPVQPLSDRGVYRCTKDNYLADLDPIRLEKKNNN